MHEKRVDDLLRFNPNRRVLKEQQDRATAELIHAQEEKAEERNRIMADREVQSESLVKSVHLADTAA